VNERSLSRGVLHSGTAFRKTVKKPNEINGLARPLAKSLILKAFLGILLRKKQQSGNA